MFLHQFEIVTPDGATTLLHTVQVLVPSRHVRVRHRLIELEPALEPGDSGLPELAVPDDYDWEDFALDEDD